MKTRLRRAAAPIAVLAVCAMALSACNDATGSGKTGSKTGAAVVAPPPDGNPIASHYMSWPGKSLRVDLLALDKVSPTRIVARFHVSNNSSAINFPNAFAGVANPQEHAAAGVLLIDPTKGSELAVLRSPSGACLCTGFAGFKAGQSQDLDAAFPVPQSGAQSLIVTFPNTPPFLDVAVASHAPYSLHGLNGAAGANPVTAAVAKDPELPLISTVQQGNETDADGGGKTKVRLSSDVVFGTNSANLTPTAQGLLKQVAAKIDQSSGSSVAIDGYADSTGSDAVNLPLSKQRAQSVQSALQKLVTRKGVQYTAAGHGSADPIADNSTDEGRALNRRVTVTFDSPQSTQSPQPVQAATADPAAQGEPQPIASVKANKTPIPLLPWSKAIVFDVDGLIRDPNGYAVLVWTFHNNGSIPVPAGFATDLHDIFQNAGPGRIVLDSGQYRYKNVEDSKEQAVFPAYPPRLGDFAAPPGQTFIGWNLFKLAPNATTVTVNVPGFPAIPNVPVQSPPQSN